MPPFHRDLHLDKGLPTTIDFSFLLTLVAGCLLPFILGYAFNLFGNNTLSMGTRTLCLGILLVLYSITSTSVFVIITPGSIVQLVADSLAGSGSPLPHIDGLLYALWLSFLCGAGVLVHSLDVVTVWFTRISDNNPDITKRVYEPSKIEQELVLALRIAQAQREQEKIEHLARERAWSEQQQQFVAIIALLQGQRSKEHTETLVRKRELSEARAQIIELQNELHDKEEQYDGLKTGIIELGEHWEEKHTALEAQIADYQQQLALRTHSSLSSSGAVSELEKRLKVRDAEIDGLKWELSTKMMKGLRMREPFDRKKWPSTTVVVTSPSSEFDRDAVFPKAEDADWDMLWAQDFDVKLLETNTRAGKRRRSSSDAAVKARPKPVRVSFVRPATQTTRASCAKVTESSTQFRF